MNDDKNALAFDDIFNDIINGVFFSPVTESVAKEDVNLSVKKENMVPLDTKTARTGKLKILFMYPDSFQMSYLRGEMVSALHRTNFKSGNSSIPGDTYNAWTGGIEDMSLLVSIQKYWNNLLDYTAKDMILRKKGKKTSLSEINNTIFENDSVSTEKIEITKTVRLKLIKNKDVYCNDSRFEVNDEKRKNEYKAKMEELISSSPIDALVLLCVLALVKPDESVVKRRILIDTVFAFFEETEVVYYENLWNAHRKGSSYECASEDSSLKFNIFFN